MHAAGSQDYWRAMSCDSNLVRDFRRVDAAERGFRHQSDSGEERFDEEICENGIDESPGFFWVGITVKLMTNLSGIVRLADGIVEQFLVSYMLHIPWIVRFVTRTSSFTSVTMVLGKQISNFRNCTDILRKSYDDVAHWNVFRVARRRFMPTIWLSKLRVLTRYWPPRSACFVSLLCHFTCQTPIIWICIPISCMLTFPSSENARRTIPACSYLKLKVRNAWSYTPSQIIHTCREDCWDWFMTIRRIANRFKMGVSPAAVN